MTNPKVLTNFVRSQIEEGKGEMRLAENVVLFTTDGGLEIRVPESMIKEKPELFKGVLKGVQAPKKEDPIVDTQTEIKDLRDEYKAIHPEGKGVPPRFINDKEWITEKISEFQNT